MKTPLNYCLALAALAACWLAFDCYSKLAERDSRIAELVREREAGIIATRDTAHGAPLPSEGIQHTAPELAPSAAVSPSNPAGVATGIPDPQSGGISSVLETLQSIRDPRKREEFINGVFRKASAMGVPAVLEWVRKLPPSDRASALLALYSEWSGKSAAHLSNNLYGRTVEFALGDYLLKQKLMSPEAAALFANQFLSGNNGNARADLLTRAAMQLVATDPARAYDLGEGLAGRQQAEFFKAFVGAWTAQDPQAAWQWVNQIADPSQKKQFQASFLVAEAETDPLAAAQKLSVLEAGSAPRSEAVRQIGARWARKDTAAALSWADALPSVGDREAAKAGISAAAPVGIGVALYAADGNAVVQGTLPGGPAERSGALMQGDRILAVTDATGTWVDFRGLLFDEILSLITGKPGSTILLQVESPNQKATRTVSITREQIMLREQ